MAKSRRVKEIETVDVKPKTRIIDENKVKTIVINTLVEFETNNAAVFYSDGGKLNTKERIANAISKQITKL